MTDTATTDTPITDTADVVDAILRLAADSALAQLRRQRPDVVRHTAASYAALFDPRDTAGIGAAERLAVALSIARLNGDEALAAHYRGRLATHAGGDRLLSSAADGAPAATDARWSAILGHAERVTTAPRAVTRADIDGLQAKGLTARDVVTLSQLIAFVNYQVRVLAGLRLLKGA